MDMVRILSSPLLAVMLTALPSVAVSRAVSTHVTCAEGRSFTLSRTEGKALVTFGQREIELTRKRSSLGPSYGSANGSLIIDQDYVAFVLDDDLSFRDCRLKQSTAVER